MQWFRSVDMPGINNPGQCPGDNHYILLKRAESELLPTTFRQKNIWTLLCGVGLPLVPSLCDALQVGFDVHGECVLVVQRYFERSLTDGCIISYRRF
jgi:hypothetical protein